MCASINIVFFLFQIEFDTPRKQRCLVFNSISGNALPTLLLLLPNSLKKCNDDSYNEVVSRSALNNRHQNVATIDFRIQPGNHM